MKNKMNKEIIIDEIINMYNNSMQNSSTIYESTENAGGKVRQSNGDLVENIFRKIVKLIADQSNIDVKITGKKEDSIRINSENGYINASVDVHILSDNQNIFAECKTYLDKCYLDRASSDLEHFKSANNKNICLIISLENAVGRPAEFYFLDKGYIDNIFYLVDGKRSSARPIWKREHFKPINRKVLGDLIDYIENSLNKKDQE
jgi:hypothetical protein